MMEEVPLSEAMPLFSPVYDPAAQALSSELRRRMQAGVFDSATNRLAEQILLKESSNYNAWYCKKRYILSAPQVDALHEFDFTNSCLGEKAKSFQVWEQKRFLLDYHLHPQWEMDVSQDVIERIDHKNYHAWSFRTCLVEKQGTWQQELGFAEDMIEEDCFNNSAWTYRFFLTSKAAEGAGEEDRKRVGEREVAFALGSIEREKSNHASWNYLRGLFPSIKLKDFSSRNALRATLIASFDAFPIVEESCQKWWKELKQEAESGKEEALKRAAVERQLLCTLVHVYSQREENRHFAVTLCDELAEKEKQRANYWKWVRSQL